MYTETLLYRLIKIELKVEFQKPIPLTVEDVRLNCGFRADLVVEDKNILEVKSIEAIADIQVSKLLSYLRSTNIKVGLLLNFNVIKMKDGIRRVVNNLII